MLLRGLERLHALFGPAAAAPLFRVSCLGRGPLLAAGGLPVIDYVSCLFRTRVAPPCLLRLPNSLPHAPAAQDEPSEHRGGGAAAREGDDQAADQLRQKRGGELQVRQGSYVYCCLFAAPPEGKAAVC